jgi:hypothetical protein
MVKPINKNRKWKEERNKASKKAGNTTTQRKERNRYGNKNGD